MKRIFVAALLAGTAISSAQAADLRAARPYTKAPAYVAQVYDWTGFYVGVNAGVGLGRSRTEQNFPNVSFDTLYQQPQGVVGGGQIGYNFQTNSSILGLGPMVFGLEADIQGSDARDGRTTVNGLDGTTTNFNQRMDWFATARGRVGLVTGSTLSYVTGGYAYGQTRSTVNQALGPVAVSNSFDRGQSGYVLGSGVEAALGGNWTGKIEYLYVNLGNRTDAFTGFSGPQTFETRVRENIFRAGLNYRIGGNNAYAALPAANWTGFYLGGNFGGATARNRSTLTAGGVTDTFNLSPDGYTGGLQAGYNWQASNIVFGVEADIQASSMRDDRTCVFSCSTIAAVAFDQKLQYFGTARGRLGYAVGSTLFYATGGYAYGQVKTSATGTSVLLAAPVSDSVTSNRSGYAVGGGIETPFTFLGLFGPQWTSKTEYLYVDLGSTTTAFTAPVGGTFTTRVTEHVFRTGINYHFNSPVVAKY